VGIDELGFHPIYDFVHHAEEVVAGWVPAIGGALTWLTNTLFSALLGLVVGLLIVGLLKLVPKRRKDEHSGTGTSAASAH
jgi:hypothetical protein